PAGVKSMRLRSVPASTTYGPKSRLTVCVVPAGCGAQPDARLVGVGGTAGVGKLGSPNCRQAACVAARSHCESYAVRCPVVVSAALGTASPAAATPTATVRTARRSEGRWSAMRSAFPRQGHVDRPGGWDGLGPFLPDRGVLHQPGMQW